MKVNDIRDLSPDEIKDNLQDLKKELFNLRFLHATNQLQNPKRITLVKKDIARIKTVMREREAVK